MIDYINAMFHTLLYGVSSTSMCAKPATQLVCFVYTGCSFLILEIAVLSRTNLCDLIRVSIFDLITSNLCSYLFSRHGKLNLVYTKLDMVVNNFTHFIWSVSVRGDTSNKFAVSPRHFFAICEIARPREVASVDGIADDNI